MAGPVHLLLMISLVGFCAVVVGYDEKAFLGDHVGDFHFRRLIGVFGTENVFHCYIIVIQDFKFRDFFREKQPLQPKTDSGQHAMTRMT